MEKIDIDDEDSLSEHLLAEEMTGGLVVSLYVCPIFLILPILRFLNGWKAYPCGMWTGCQSLAVPI